MSMGVATAPSRFAPVPFANKEALAHALVGALKHRHVYSVTVPHSMAVLDYVESHFVARQASAEPVFERAAETGLARSLFWLKEGDELEAHLLLTKRKQGDPILGKGTSKIYSLAWAVRQMKFFATAAGLDGYDLEGNSFCERERGWLNYLKSEPYILPVSPRVVYPAKPLKTKWDKWRYIAPLAQYSLLESLEKWGDRTSPEILLQKLIILKKVFAIVAYLFRWGALHRDLKPANFVVAEGDLKIIDFGGSSSVDDIPALSAWETTLVFLAPEWAELLDLDAQEFGPDYVRLDPKAAERWSTGIIAFMFITGRYPINIDLPPEKIIKKIMGLKSGWFLERATRCPATPTGDEWKPLLGIINQLLDPDFKKRPRPETALVEMEELIRILDPSGLASQMQL